MQGPRPAAVVVGEGINALGVLRSLARGGVDTFAVIVDRASPVGWSRYGTKIQVPGLGGTDLTAALLQWARKIGSPALRPVLFLTEERGVEAVAARRDEMLAHFRFTTPPGEVLGALMHKERFQRTAEACGARIPRSIHLDGPVSAGNLASLRFPVILKPAARNYEYARHFAKAYRCESAAQVVELVARIVPVCADLIVQEWIEGADSDIYFCLVYIGRSPGERIAFTGRKLRSWPPRVGGTASCVAAPEVHDVLAAETFAFFDAVGFSGLGSMEFKRDRRDSRFYMVEPTVGRTDFQQEVATVNGVNIPLCVFRWENGEPADPGQVRVPPVAWFDRDAVTRARQREAGAGIDWMTPHAVEALFRWTDPVPALLSRVYPNVRRVQRLIRRLVTVTG